MSTSEKHQPEVQSRKREIPIDGSSDEDAGSVKSMRSGISDVTRQHKPAAPKNDGNSSNKPSNGVVSSSGSSTTTKPTTYTLHEGTVSQKP